MAIPREPKSLGSEVLLETAAFASLGPRRCAVLARCATRRVHAKGEAVFREESVSEGLYIIVRGALRLNIRTAMGGSVVVGEQAAPAAIVTVGLLDGGPNRATGIAASDCTAYILRRDPFIRFCRRNPDATIGLLSEIGAHLRRTSAFIDLMTAAGIHQRLARVLLDLMEEQGNPHFLLPCTHTELAARLGTVRELISRNLKLLEDRGVLRVAGKDISITDAPALVSAAGACIGAAHVFEPHAAPPNPACFVLQRSKEAGNVGHLRQPRDATASDRNWTAPTITRR